MTRFMSDGTKEEHVVFVALPASLMQKFCVLQPVGETVGELGEAYIHNTLCGKKYEAQVDEQQKFFETIKEKGKKDGERKD